MGRPSQYSPELRERAIRLVQDQGSNFVRLICARDKPREQIRELCSIGPRGGRILATAGKRFREAHQRRRDPWLRNGLIEESS